MYFQHYRMFTCAWFTEAWWADDMKITIVTNLISSSTVWKLEGIPVRNILVKIHLLQHRANSKNHHITFCTSLKRGFKVTTFCTLYPSFRTWDILEDNIRDHHPQDRYQSHHFPEIHNRRSHWPIPGAQNLQTLHCQMDNNMPPLTWQIWGQQ